ncbi:DgyrCDS13253 [Dimorphilus gyrociliatus]|uniref:DgyrCDS13253 n=1 Tax=Dimorphilus gyrociliatus TaxID=2664684 RepID=A0A7I8WA45_9ANNE|nr:DgyrCDS13253 [Dimorphilus gyrociliatus]
MDETKINESSLPRSISTPVIKSEKEMVNELTNKHMKRRQMLADRMIPVLIGLSAFFIFFLVFLQVNSTKKACNFDKKSMKTVCTIKGLLSIPEDISKQSVSLHMGSKLDKFENHLSVLKRSNLSNLHLLIELKLVKCGIEDIEPNTFLDLQNLKRLDLSYNRIVSINEHIFKGLQTMEYIILSNNPLTVVGNNVFSAMNVGEIIFGNNPALTHISKEAFKDSSIGKLVINRANLFSVENDSFLPIRSSLNELDITNNLQNLQLPFNIFDGLHLKRLSLVNNGLKNPFYFLKKASTEILILDDNPLEDFDLSDVESVKSIVVLSMNNCHLKTICEKNLKNLNNLQEIYMDSNRLKTLNLTIFATLKKLNKIDMSNNEIEVLHPTILSVLKSIETLELDGNQIRRIPETFQPLFESLKSITLHANPLHCNCELRWFVKWLENFGDKVEHLEKIQCSTPIQKNITLISNYGFQCRPPTIFNATIGSDSLTLVCMADGDPPPEIIWTVLPEGVTLLVTNSPFSRSNFMVKSVLTITKHGNYTCSAKNMVGSDQVIVDTRNIPLSGLKFEVESREIDILETPQGFIFTAVLIFILGYIFKYY